jgi:hypothetical protein
MVPLWLPLINIIIWQSIHYVDFLFLSGAICRAILNILLHQFFRKYINA